MLYNADINANVNVDIDTDTDTDIPEYNRIDKENDDLLVQDAKKEAIRNQRKGNQ